MPDLEQELRSQLHYVRQHLEVPFPDARRAMQPRHRRRSLRLFLAGLLSAGAAVGGSIALVGALSGHTPSPVTTTTTATTASASKAPASPQTPTRSTTASTSAQNLFATSAVKSALTAAYIAYTHFPASDIAGTEPGSVYYAYLPPTDTYWALAMFAPSATASGQTIFSLKDTGNVGIFSRQTGGNWSMISPGSLPFCPSQTTIPSSVQALWGLSDPQSCDTTTTTPPSPLTATSSPRSAPLGATITASATLSGIPSTELGTIVFEIDLGTGTQGQPAFTITLPYAGPGAYQMPMGYTPTVSGTYFVKVTAGSAADSTTYQVSPFGNSDLTTTITG
jgi:hypothetical protein